MQIVALCGESAGNITQQLSAWPAKQTGASSAPEPRTRGRRSTDEANCRLILLAERDGDFSKLVAASAPSSPRSRTASLVDSRGSLFRSRTTGRLTCRPVPRAGVADGRQLRDLACTFPEMLDSLEAANSGWTKPQRLSDLIYPHPAFTPDVRAQQEQKLRSTDVVNPLSGRGTRAWHTLQRFGIRADAFAGHSYGELVALCAAGVYDSATLHRLSRERGGSMAALAGDSGGMLAVHAALDVVENALAAESLDLVIANYNSPTQFVLSGTTAEVTRAGSCVSKTASPLHPLAGGGRVSQRLGDGRVRAVPAGAPRNRVRHSQSAGLRQPRGRKISRESG